MRETCSELLFDSGSVLSGPEMPGAVLGELPVRCFSFCCSLPNIFG